MSAIKDGYTLTGGPTGCLLIHGFTSTPAELYPLGHWLHQQGYRVHSPLLAGHGTRPQDLEGVQWQDWHDSVEEGLSVLKQQCTRVVVIGHSLGGLLALQLSSKMQPHALVTLAAAVRPRNRVLPLAGILSRVKPYERWPEKARPAEAQQFLQGYERFPLTAAYQVHLLAKQVKKQLGNIQCPTLIVHPRDDQSVDAASVTILCRNLGTNARHVYWMEDAGHNLTVDPRPAQKQKLFDRITSFLHEYQL